MRTTRATIAVAIACVLALAGTACGSSGSDSGGDTSSEDTAAPTSDVAVTEPTSDDSSPELSEGPLLAGALNVDGEDIELNPGRCVLQEQPAAIGGGVIELTAQATGTNRAGDPVLVDFARYSADSEFAGDVVTVTSGDPFDGTATELIGTSEAGTVSVDGFEVSATDFEVTEDGTSPQAISFTINC